jgi:gluconolactonase
MRLVAFLFFVAALIPAAAQEPVRKIEKFDPALDALLDTTAKIEVLGGGFDWSEGPVWDPKNSRVLFSDIPKNMVWSWNATEGLKKFLHPAGFTGTAKFTGREPGSNGLAFNKAGELVLCQHGDRRIAKLVDGKFVTLADKYEGKRLNSPNDLVFHSNGDLYFTDPPYGLPGNVKDPAKELDFQGVYRLKPDGKLTLLTKEMTRPNGIALSPDEKTLYVANSDPEQSVWKSLPIKDDGTVGEGKVFYDTGKWVKEKKPGLNDGLKVDQQGNLWATGPGGVLIFNKDGKLLGLISTSVPTANCGFGDDGSTLYITANKELLRVKTKVKGIGFGK